MKWPRLYLGLVSCALALTTIQAQAIDAQATAKALRIVNTITGGIMPTSDPLFPQIVTKVAAGDMVGAAALAANSPYFANYLGRRMALQMQTPSLDSSGITDSDATTFIIAHFIGAGGTKPSISSIWSENATYLVASNGTAAHPAGLSTANLRAVDWNNISRVDGQQIILNSTGTTRGAIPPQHVGGYATLSDRANDNSFAMYGATAGTNLRMIEGIWEISTGLGLMDFASSAAPSQEVPRFIPEYDPNFFQGSGQPACISCHGGGLSSISHGYSTVADIFNFDPAKGFIYIDNPSTSTRKSLGSDSNKRNTNNTCNLVRTPTAACNPDSSGVDPNQAWDVSKIWQASGVLNTLGWKGSTSGQGLNSLGAELGKATIVYEFLTKRVINEICPMGTFSSGEVSAIAAAANPYASPPGTDDIRTIVAKVAAQSTCL